MPVGVADRDVGRGLVVALVRPAGSARDENPWIGRQDGRLDEPAVGQREEVEAVVDEVELVGPLEGVRDVETLDDLRLDVGILRVPASDDRGEVGPTSPSRAVAKSVTSTPLATSPSVRSDANCSHGP